MRIAADLDREFCSHLHMLLYKSRVARNTNLTHFNNGVFEINEYSDKCTCGYTDIEDKWVSSHSHSEICYQADFQRLMSEYKAKNMSIPVGKINKIYEKHHIPFDNFPNLHCTCEYMEGWKSFRSLLGHKLDCQSVIPNFKYGDLEARWYKYLGKGMDYSREFSREEMNEIFKICEVSLCRMAVLR